MARDDASSVVPAPAPDYWQGRKVLITGGAGFVGGSLAVSLARRGAGVVVLVRDRKCASTLRALNAEDHVDCAFGMVTDQPTLERLLASERITDVFHLAAEALVGVALKSPAAAFDSNIRGTWSVLEACRRVPVKSIVVASSDKVYGTHERLPYDESFHLLAKGPYEVSKACADLVAQSYATTYELPVAITRCANIYGPGDTNWDRLVPGTIRSILQDTRPVLRSDGTMARDYLFIDDAIEGYLTLGEAVASRAELAGLAFNFGTGTAIFVADMVRRIATAAGRAYLIPEDRPGTEAAGEIQKQCVSSAKARRWLSWQPRVCLDNGLQKALSWYADHLRRPIRETPRDARDAITEALRAVAVP